MKKFTRLLLLILGVISLIPTFALAHTGIGETTGFGAGIGHPIEGSDHVLAMIAVGLWAVQMGERAIFVMPATFVTLMIFGGTLAIFGIHIPYFEGGILLSVIILGMLITSSSRFSLVASSFVVGAFALFHGQAHGTEIPLSIGALSYSLGFSLGTTLLHVVGIIGGLVLKRMDIEWVIRLIGGTIALGGVYLTVA